MAKCPIDVCGDNHDEDLDRCVFYLSPEAWDKLMDILAEPPEPSQYMIDAAKRYKDMFKQ